MNKFLSLLAASAIFTASAKEYIVKFKDASKLSSKSMTVKGIGNIPFIDTHAPGAIAKIDISSKSAKQTAATLAKILQNPDVEYVTESFKVHLLDHADRTDRIDTTTLKDQWAIKKVEAEKAWDTAGNTGSRNVIVAIVDTGMAYDHESLKDNAIQGYDFKNNDNDPDDEYDPNWHTTHKNPGHGTHCAGIVGATGLINGGTVGISPTVSIMPLKFIGIDGSGDLMSAIKAMDYAIQNKADVISASWGAEVDPSQAQPLIDAVKRVSDAGVIMVSAAGNGDQNGKGFSNDTRNMYPANAIFENTITVAASDPNDAITVWSNFGRKSVQVASPGLNIMSTLPPNTYDLLSGTSMATPLVSGLVALIKAQNKNLTGMEVRSIIQQSATKASIETACNCRVDAANAIDAIKSSKPVLVPYAYTIPKGGSVKFELLNGNGAVTYTSSNPAVGAIDASGNLTGASEGETIVTATDSAGNTVKSESIFVWNRAAAGTTCPFGDQATCDALCQINPQFPWCSGSSSPLSSR